MSLAVVCSLHPDSRSNPREGSFVTATYTFDVLSSLDGRLVALHPTSSSNRA